MATVHLFCVGCGAKRKVNRSKGFTAKFCTDCGGQFEAESSVSIVTWCFNCGANRRKISGVLLEYCSECGASFTGGQPKTPTPPEKKKQQRPFFSASDPADGYWRAKNGKRYMFSKTSDRCYDAFVISTSQKKDIFGYVTIKSTLITLEVASKRKQTMTGNIFTECILWEGYDRWDRIKLPEGWVNDGRICSQCGMIRKMPGFQKICDECSQEEKFVPDEKPGLQYGEDLTIEGTGNNETTGTNKTRGTKGEARGTVGDTSGTPEITETSGTPETSGTTEISGSSGTSGVNEPSEIRESIEPSETSETAKTSGTIKTSGIGRALADVRGHSPGSEFDLVIIESDGASETSPEKWQKPPPKKPEHPKPKCIEAPTQAPPPPPPKGNMWAETPLPSSGGVDMVNNGVSYLAPKKRTRKSKITFATQRNLKSSDSLTDGHWQGKDGTEYVFHDDHTSIGRYTVLLKRNLDPGNPFGEALVKGASITMCILENSRSRTGTILIQRIMWNGGDRWELKIEPKTQPNSFFGVGSALSIRQSLPFEEFVHKYDDFLEEHKKEEESKEQLDKKQGRPPKPQPPAPSLKNVGELIQYSDEQIFQVVKKNRFGLAQNRLVALDRVRRVLRVLTPDMKCRSEFPLDDIDDAVTVSLPKNHLRIIFQEQRHHRPYDLIFSAKVDFETFMLVWWAIAPKKKKPALPSLQTHTLSEHGVGDTVYKIVRVTGLALRLRRELMISAKGNVRIINPEDGHCDLEVRASEIQSIHKLGTNKFLWAVSWIDSVSSSESYTDRIELHPNKRAPIEIRFCGEFERTHFCSIFLKVHEDVEFCGFPEGYPQPLITQSPSSVMGRDRGFSDFEEKDERKHQHEEEGQAPTIGEPDHVRSVVQATFYELGEGVKSPKKDPSIYIQKRTSQVPKDLDENDRHFKDVYLCGHYDAKKEMDIYVGSTKGNITCYISVDSTLDKEIAFKSSDLLELKPHATLSRVIIVFEPVTEPTRHPFNDDETKYDLQKDEIEFDIEFPSHKARDGFVNCIDTISPLESKQRQQVINEIIVTEESYIRGGLELLKVEFLEPIKSDKILHESEYNKVFSNVEEILKFHQIFYHELKKKENIPKVFATYNPFLRMYTQYIDEYDIRQEALKTLKLSKPVFAEFMEQKEQHNLLIDALLITVVQRIPRYVLLLGSLLNETPKRHPEYGILDDQCDKMTSILGQVDSSKKQAEKRRELMELKRKIVHGPDLNVPHRQLLETSVLKERGVHVATRHIILMSDIFFYTDVSWYCLGIFDLSVTSYEPVTTDKYMGFELRSDLDLSKSVLFMCDSKEEQRHWKTEFETLKKELRRKSKSFRFPTTPVHRAVD